MKIKNILSTAIIACATFLAACGGNIHRIVYNSNDSIVSTVNLAERAWSSYTVSTAKNELTAAGIKPTSEAITAKVNENPNLAKYIELDADYRIAFAAYIQAYEAFQAGGENGVLDPMFRAKAIAAANAVIDAVATISGKTLNKVN